MAFVRPNKRKGIPTNPINGVKYFILQLKNCIMETSCWLDMRIGDPITANRVGVSNIKYSEMLNIKSVKIKLDKTDLPTQVNASMNKIECHNVSHFGDLPYLMASDDFSLRSFKSV